MSKKTAKDIDYEKLNALNLYNKDLGDAYLSMQWDPLGPDFRLDLPYIEKYLKTTKDKSEVKSPDFLNRSRRESIQAFKNALTHNNQVKRDLQNKYDLGEFALHKNVNIEEQVKDIIFFLECREQMLNIAIGKIKSNKIGVLQAYKNIYSLNKKLSALLEETYKKEYDRKILIENMLLFAERERLEAKKLKMQQEQTLKNVNAPQFVVGKKMIATANIMLEMLKQLGKTVSNTVENILNH